ncbi:hypothetical protein BYT27DRAFT_7261172 [Phlegmacium glaucopus]|nr:hypothetical protein BYT27DRAFT_7261172 [Phlegmacium glaucopus]
MADEDSRGHVIAADVASRSLFVVDPHFPDSEVTLNHLANIDHGIGEVQHKADGIVVGAAAVALFEAEILKAHYR